MIRSLVEDGFTYAGGMSPYARPANRMIVYMEGRCMVDGHSSNQLDGGREEQDCVLSRKKARKKTGNK